MATSSNRDPLRSPFRCGDGEALVSYVYESCDSTERDDVEAHLAVCTSCAQEVRELRAARGALQSWTPPERSFGFRIVAAEPPPETPGRSLWTWAAAAVIVLAAAGALANLEVRHGPDGWVFRMGWAGSRASEAAVVQTPDDAVSPTELARVEAELRRDIERLVSAPAAVTTEPAGSSPASTDATDLLRRVRALVEESERRQQRELALRLMQMNQEVQDQRLFDLATINQGFTQINQDFNQLDYLVRVSQR